jgi:chromosome partitioning protein
MVKIIAITNQKGGVGKTTTAINLTACLALKKAKVLLIDCDPQGNATTGSGVDKNTIEWGLQDVLLENCKIQQAILETAHAYHLLPTNADLTAAEVGLMQQNQRSHILKQAIDEIKSHYDYILIDCPPALNTLTLNALVASTDLFIPMQCEYFALEGLAALLSTMQQVQQHLNPHLKLLGILRTMYDPRSRLSQEVSKQLLQHFADKVFRVCIPKNVKLAEAPSHGLPVSVYSRLSVGSKAYMVLAEEINARMEMLA